LLQCIRDEDVALDVR